MSYCLTSGDRSEDIAPTRRALEERLFHSWAPPPYHAHTRLDRGATTRKFARSCVMRSFAFSATAPPSPLTTTLFGPILTCASHRTVLSPLVSSKFCPAESAGFRVARIVSNPPASSVYAHCRLRARRNHKRPHCPLLRPKAFFSEPQINHSRGKDFTMN